jgi:peptide subunit release factor 1 (eRF1)
MTTPLDVPTSLRARLEALAGAGDSDSPVVSVYLNTRWSDEHQRERVRAFLKREVRRAREVDGRAALDEDLHWIERQVDAVIGHAGPDAQGVALFACRARGLREIVAVRTPFEDSFSVGPHAVLSPLAAQVHETLPTLVVFIDGKSARLIPLAPDGLGEEVALAHDVERRHRRGGWALLAQSRYQRHIEHHRAQHFEAVAETLGHLVEEREIETIVLAGEARTVALFLARLPRALAARVAGTVTGARHEAAVVLARRASDLLARVDHARDEAAVEALVTEALKGGRAVVGIEHTLEAAARGAVRRLYVMKGFSAVGRECAACGALHHAPVDHCVACGAVTRDVQLCDAMVDRVIAASGDVEFVDEASALRDAGAVGATLRYPVGVMR